MIFQTWNLWIQQILNSLQNISWKKLMILDQCAAVCSKPAIVIQSTLTTSIVKYLFRFVTYCYGTLFAQNSFVVVVHNSTLKRVGCKLLYPSPQKRLFTLAALRKSKKRGKSHQTKKLPNVLFQWSILLDWIQNCIFRNFTCMAINFYTLCHRNDCLLWLPCINLKKGQKSPNEKVTQSTTKVQVF